MKTHIRREPRSDGKILRDHRQEEDNVVVAVVGGIGINLAR